MFYIKENEQIVLVDEVKQNLINSLEFMPQYQDLPILETKDDETIVDFKLMTIEEAKALEEMKEKERIAKLHLTGADVERGIYKAKDMDFSDIVAMLESNPPKGLDIKALKIELKANNFYRGNPYVEAVGKILGFTDKQLTMFFKTNDYKELLYEDTTDTTKPTIKQDEVPQESI